jgi:hypothetical protein
MRAEAGEIARCVFAAADLPPDAFARLTRDVQALRRSLEQAAQT